MKCTICKKETDHKYSNKVICKKHILKAKDQRDMHNENIRKGCEDHVEYMHKDLVYVFNSKRKSHDKAKRATLSYYLTAMWE